jgi:hypothetical protein
MIPVVLDDFFTFVAYQPLALEFTQVGRQSSSAIATPIA